MHKTAVLIVTKVNQDAHTRRFHYMREAACVVSHLGDAEHKWPQLAKSLTVRFCPRLACETHRLLTCRLAPAT